MRVDPPLTPKEYARLLRRNLTAEEKKIWDLLRDRQFRGFKFRRQHPIKVWDTNCRDRFYVADFYCAAKRLVVEIDGPVHEQQADYDAGRDFVMQQLGLHVLRITNQEVNENITAVLNKIRYHLEKNDTP